MKASESQRQPKYWGGSFSKWVATVLPTEEPEESWVAGEDLHFCSLEHHRENLCFYNILICLRWLKILSLAYKRLKQSLMVDLQKFPIFFSSHFLNNQVVELRGMLSLVSVPG